VHNNPIRYNDPTGHETDQDGNEIPPQNTNPGSEWDTNTQQAWEDANRQAQAMIDQLMLELTNGVMGSMNDMFSGGPGFSQEQIEEREEAFQERLQAMFDAEMTASSEQNRAYFDSVQSRQDAALAAQSDYNNKGSETGGTASNSSVKQEVVGVCKVNGNETQEMIEISVSYTIPPIARNMGYSGPAKDTENFSYSSDSEESFYDKVRAINWRLMGANSQGDLVFMALRFGPDGKERSATQWELSCLIFGSGAEWKGFKGFFEDAEKMPEGYKVAMPILQFANLQLKGEKTEDTHLKALNDFKASDLYRNFVMNNVGSGPKIDAMLNVSMQISVDPFAYKYMLSGDMRNASEVFQNIIKEYSVIPNHPDSAGSGWSKR
jgi:hypothetical protein